MVVWPCATGQAPFMKTLPMTRRSMIEEIINGRNVSPFQRSVFLLCGLVLVLDGFAAQSIGFLARAMADSLHVPVKSFGPVFAAALVGLMLSSIAAGPIADRVGRKWPIIFSTLTFATFTLAAPCATSLRQLVVLRFLTGLGLGGAIPNVIALTSEYAPKRLRHTLITMISCGMPLGALLGGLLSFVMLPRWGWPSVFYAGGILPLLLALLLIVGLPESILFLSVRGRASEKIFAILHKIDPGMNRVPSQINLTASPSSRRNRVPALALFSQRRALGTILLWIPFFMNLLVLYFIVSWLPALLRQVSNPLSSGILAVSLFSLGGILGSLLQGNLMTRWGDVRILSLEFLLAGALMGSLAYAVTLLAIMTATFLLGCFVQGAQAGLNALSARYYPTSMRATGVGWALGVGRLGSIVGPVLGGLLLSRAWSPRQILLFGAVPALFSAAAILASRFFRAAREMAQRAEAEDLNGTILGSSQG